MMARLPARRPDPLYDPSPWSGIGSIRAVDPGIGWCWVGNGGFGGPDIPVFLDLTGCTGGNTSATMQSINPNQDAGFQGIHTSAMARHAQTVLQERSARGAVVPQGRRYSHASVIKSSAKGSRRGPRRKTRTTQQERTQGRVALNGAFDERGGAARDGFDSAQGKA